MTSINLIQLTKSKEHFPTSKLESKQLSKLSSISAHKLTKSKSKITLSPLISSKQLIKSKTLSSSNTFKVVPKLPSKIIEQEFEETHSKKNKSSIKTSSVYKKSTVLAKESSLTKSISIKESNINIKTDTNPKSLTNKSSKPSSKELSHKKTEIISEPTQVIVEKTKESRKSISQNEKSPLNKSVNDSEYSNDMDNYKLFWEILKTKVIPMKKKNISFSKMVSGTSRLSKIESTLRSSRKKKFDAKKTWRIVLYRLKFMMRFIKFRYVLFFILLINSGFSNEEKRNCL
jgi:hypothetical protein